MDRKTEIQQLLNQIQLIENEVSELKRMDLVSRRAKKFPIIELSLTIISLFWSITILTKSSLNITLFAHSSNWGLGFVFFFSGALTIWGVVSESCILRKIGLTLMVVMFALVSANYYITLGKLSLESLIYAVLALQALWRIREVGERPWQS